MLPLKIKPSRYMNWNRKSIKMTIRDVNKFKLSWKNREMRQNNYENSWIIRGNPGSS